VTTVDVHRTVENESLVGLEDELSEMGMTTSSKRGKKKKKKKVGADGNTEEGS